VLLKENINSDCEQFHKYQLNEQSPLTFFYWIQKIPRLMTLVIQILAWDRHKHVAGF